MQLLVCTQRKTYAAYMSSHGKNEWSTDDDTVSTLDDLLEWLERAEGNYSVDVSGDNVVILRLNTVGDVIERNTIVCEQLTDKSALTEALLKLLPEAV